jgi:hypothetical protein
VLARTARTDAPATAARRGREPVVALAERTQQLRVALGQRLGQLTLERDEERSLRRRARSSTSASFETPTNGEPSTLTSASSS